VPWGTLSDLEKKKMRGEAAEGRKKKEKRVNKKQE